MLVNCNLCSFLLNADFSMYSFHRFNTVDAAVVDYYVVSNTAMGRYICLLSRQATSFVCQLYEKSSSRWR
jgi:hypothetical protein